jgi:hypothetical protein
MDAKVDFWLEVKEIFRKISEKFDLLWQKRKRVLDSQLLVAFLLKLVESKNRQGYGSNLAQFWESCLDKGILYHKSVQSQLLRCVKLGKNYQKIFL